MQCPCCSSKSYTQCCQKAHNNIHSVFTAEALMRSRYSAFVLADIEYLQKSHHSTTRPSSSEKREILLWTQSVTWLKLEVLNTHKGTVNDNTGIVEFKAYFMENGCVNIIHEISTFCKEKGYWTYLKGK